ncbi:MAG TPA: hypothetical protein VEY51_21020, partial [Chondromyces sp.]|nr:hypothetical protein [Chondromyces sp.]
GFAEESCVTLAELEELAEGGRAETILRPMEEGISHLPKWLINDNLAEKIRNGAVLNKTEDWPEGSEEVAVFHHSNLLAIYQPHPKKTGLVKPVKVLSE